LQKAQLRNIVIFQPIYQTIQISVTSYSYPYFNRCVNNGIYPYYLM